MRFYSSRDIFSFKVRDHELTSKRQLTAISTYLSIYQLTLSTLRVDYNPHLRFSPEIEQKLSSTWNPVLNVYNSSYEKGSSYCHWSSCDDGLRNRYEMSGEE